MCTNNTCVLCILLSQRISTPPLYTGEAPGPCLVPNLTSRFLALQSTWSRKVQRMCFVLHTLLSLRLSPPPLPPSPLLSIRLWPFRLSPHFFSRQDLSRVSSQRRRWEREREREWLVLPCQRDGPLCRCLEELEEEMVCVRLQERIFCLFWNNGGIYNCLTQRDFYCINCIVSTS